MAKRVHRMWLWLALFAVALLIVSNGIWAYTVADQAITITYMGEGYAAAENALELTRSVIPEMEFVSSRRDLVVILRQMQPEAFIVDDEEAVSIAGLTFRFKNDRIVRVDY